MKKLYAILAALAVLGCCVPLARAAGDLSAEISIPSKKFILTNGLTLIVHEDHKAPIVAVNLWYHVGSKNEKPGKTGFAHLFEHLMFTGSEHMAKGHNQRAFFETMESIGATDLNGTTSNDRTDFFETVPKNALDVALWVESDRMANLLGAIDQAKLDEQRGVVQNEKRQNENQPYGASEELIVKGTAPAAHPYSWTVIGSMDDLNAASLYDVQTWFKTYYGPANAVLVLSGDVDTTNALDLVNKYFGSIPSGPPVSHWDSWISKMGGTRREEVTDRVPQARIYMVWNVPRYGEQETTRLDLLANLLAQGKSSRLYKRLVFDEQLATAVEAYVDEREINSQFVITVTVRPGGDVAKAEAEAREEVAKLLVKGPTKDELDRVKTAYFADFIRGTERMGGFGGVSDILAMNETFRGSPDYYKTILAQVREATAPDLVLAGRRWLSDGVYILHLLPFPDYQTLPNEVDRSHIPAPEPAPEVAFPKLQREKLSNGLNVILAERHGLPLVSFDMLIDAGYAADQFDAAGAAKLAMDMIPEGTKDRTALQISDELESLGADLGASSDLDLSYVHLSAVKPNIGRALDLFADVILNPSFPESDFNRLKHERLAEIQNEKTTPHFMALRLLPLFLYGKDHAYGNPFTGSGTEESVGKLLAADMVAFHKTWFKPNNATLIVVGDTKMSALLPRLEKLFGHWRPGKVPEKNIGPVETPHAPAIYLVDRPGSLQSVIMIGGITEPTGGHDHIAMETLNNILGGAFTSRLNMDLREEKHWSYGVRSMLVPARGPSPLIIRAPVQTDRTQESMIELNKELRGILQINPVTDDELETAKKDMTLKLPGQWETEAHLADAIKRVVRFDWPDDYYKTYPTAVRALTQAEVEAAARLVVHPDQLVWVVVGDRSKIEPGLRSLGWGKINVIDADGNSTNNDFIMPVYHQSPTPK